MQRELLEWMNLLKLLLERLVLLLMKLILHCLFLQLPLSGTDVCLGRGDY